MAGWLQFTLDLFGAAADPAPPARVRDDEAQPGTVRSVVLQGSRVNYRLLRARRRSIGMTVRAEGLTVSAPRWVTIGEIESVLQSRADWILRKFVQLREREAQADALRIDWRDGAPVPVLGCPVPIRLDPAHARVARVEGASGVPVGAAVPDCLPIALPPDAAPARIRDAAQAWLMQRARLVFTDRLEHFAPRLGVRWTRLSLSSAGTRWGSARADGAIRLHWRLVHFQLPVIDYVVAHELSHLRVMDHSPRFWETVESVMPDYADRRRHLKGAVLPPW